MQKRQINPWTWQERFGFAQGWRVDGPQSIVFVAGQVAVSPDGEVVAAGDIEEQTRLAFQNMGSVLQEAGASFEDLVKVNFYLTDMTKLREAARVRDEFVNTAEPPASTAVGVAALALPGLMIEVEAIAVL
jgi:enamine deaminase RidA (YjgF/YER057c/UK114 family)